MKPDSFKIHGRDFATVHDDRGIVIGLEYEGQWQGVVSKDWKDFYTWLGNAIQYLESKESPKDGAAGEDKE